MRDLSLHILDLMQNSIRAQAALVKLDVSLSEAGLMTVVIEDDVLLGANSVVIEGCRVGKGAVVAAGAVVTEDVPAGAVVAGCPARVIKMKDEKTEAKTALVDALRTL